MNGKQHKANVSWEDKDDGLNVYFGDSSMIETDRFIAVVDQGLPTTLGQSLETAFPILLEVL